MLCQGWKDLKLQAVVVALCFVLLRTFPDYFLHVAGSYPPHKLLEMVITCIAG